MSKCVRRAVSSVLCLLAFPVGTALADDTQMAVDGIRMESPHPYRSTRGGEVWSDVLVRPYASALSVYFERLDMGSDDYLVVSNGEEELIFTAADGEGFWTPPLTGNTLTVELYAAARGSGWGVWIDRYRADYTPDPTMSIYRRNDLVEIADTSDYVYFARGPVGRVYMEGIGYCSGFLFGGDRFMTNYHCVDDQSMCERTVVEFNYEVDRSGAPTEVDTRRCVSVLDADSGLDYAVLDLEGTPNATWGNYGLANRIPSPNEQGYIIQHPGGARKEASLPPNCALLGVADGNESSSDFRHQCDTLSGSSGAPVLTGALTVIGLHHFGGAGLSSRSANQAVRMDKILDRCTACD